MFTIAVALSLLLFLATAALVLVSLDRSISRVQFTPERARVKAIFLDHYSVGLFETHTDFVDTSSGRHFRNTFMATLYPTGWQRGVPHEAFQSMDAHSFSGIAWGETHTTYVVETIKQVDQVNFLAAIPLWMPLLLFAILPGVYIAQLWNARHRQEAGCCPNCGYNRQHQRHLPGMRDKYRGSTTILRGRLMSAIKIKQSLERGNAIATIVLAFAAIGCRPNRPASTAIPKASNTMASSREDFDAVRSMWTQSWARKNIGKDYDEYLASSPEDKRKDLFARIAFEMQRASQGNTLTGNQCIDLIGRPDRWIQATNGEATLVYFYSAAGRDIEELVMIDANGYVSSFGFNRAGINVYGPEWRR